MDKQDFAERVLACEHKLYRVCYAMLARDTDCEDAVQEAILRAWAKRGSLREDRYFETWLTRIAINECKRALARRASRPTEELPEQAAAPPTAFYDGFDGILNELPAVYRVTLLLHYDEGYAAPEIAQMTGVPAATVRWRLHRARELLRTMLLKEECV